MESFVLFGLRLHVPVNTFSVMLGRFPGLNQHYISKEDEVSSSRTQHRSPVRFEPATMIKESDTLPTQLAVHLVLSVLESRQSPVY